MKSIIWSAVWRTCIFALLVFAVVWHQMWITGSTVVAIALLVWLIYVAQYEKQTCYVPTGTLKLAVEGESFAGAIPNLSGTGFHFDKKTGNILQGDEKDFPHPMNFYGIYLVSLKYPLRQLHVWPIDYGKEPEKEDALYTSTLPLFHTCKILVEGVELADGSKINALVNVTFRTVNPALAVFAHGGKFVTLGTASVKGVVADFGRDKTYEKFTSLDKEGEDSGFSMYVKKINDDVGGMAGLEKAYGIVVHKAEFESFSLAEASPEEQAALTAVRVAKSHADAAVEKAREITTLATAEANALEQMLEKALAKTGGMEAYQTRIIGDSIANFKGGALSIGNGGLPFAVAASKPTA